MKLPPAVVTFSICHKPRSCGKAYSWSGPYKTLQQVKRVWREYQCEEPDFFIMKVTYQPCPISPSSSLHKK